MPLPVRRTTPQPRPRPVRPSRIVPAVLAAPQAKPTLATRGHVWIPRPRITASRLVRPAALASPQAKATLVARSHVWIPRPRIAGSRLVRPAPIVAAAAVPATLAQQGIKRPVPKPGHPYLAAAPLASPQATATVARQGIRRGPTRPYRSRLVVPVVAVASGLVVSTQTQSGITGGPPGNNSTETDVTWTDASGNGWRVGMIPAYGGALIAPWYEMTAGAPSITETSLATSSPDGFIHVLAQSPTGPTPYSGTEDPTYTLTELVPTGQPLRRGYDSGTLAPSTGPALNYRVRTYIYPGDPGLLVHRIDITNPSGSAVALAATDSLEVAMLGGLTQALQSGTNAWQPANGFYANVGGTETAWPVGLVTADPDYAYITPQSGAGLTLSPIVVRKTGLAVTGGTSLQVQYLTNPNRLKLKLQETLASFPGSTTYSLYYLQALKKSLAAGEANSVAADYLNPGTPTMTAGTFTSFSYDEGAYVFASSSGNSAAFTLPISGSVSKRWNPRFKITGWTSTSLGPVTLGGTPLVSGTDFLSYIDTGNQILYLVLLKGLVASGPGTGELTNAAFVLGTLAAPPALLGVLRRQIAKSSRPRLVLAAPLASSQAASTSVVGVKRGPTRPYRSRLVTPAVLASSQAVATIARQGIRRGPTRPYRSRLIVPAPFVAPPIAAVLNLHGVRWPVVRPYRSRLTTPALLASPQAKATLVARGRVWIPRPRVTASRLVIPASVVVAVASPATLARQGVKRGPTKPLRSAIQFVSVPFPPLPAVPSAAVAEQKLSLPTRSRSRLVVPVPVVVIVPVAAVLSLHGARWPAVRPYRSRLVTPAPFVAPPVGAVLSLHGARRPSVRPYRSRLVVPAPLATAQTASTRRIRGQIWKPRPLTTPSRRVAPAPFIAPAVAPSFAQGVKRGPTPRPGKPRSLVAPAAAPQARSTNPQGVKRGPTKPLRPRLTVAPLAASQAAAFIRAGVRRIHPKPYRSPQAQVIVGVSLGPSRDIELDLGQPMSRWTVGKAGASRWQVDAPGGRWKTKPPVI